MIKLGLMSIENCSDSSDALFSLIEEVRLDYQEPEKPTRRGRRADFSELSFLLLAVVAVVTRTYSDSELHRLLQKDPQLLAVLGFPRVPHRTWILRRLKSLLACAENQVALFGKQILAEVEIPAEASEISATDGRMYQAISPKWHRRDRLKQQIPVGLRRVDTESSWSRSGYRGSRARLSACFANSCFSLSGSAFCRLAREFRFGSRAAFSRTRRGTFSNYGG